MQQPKEDTDWLQLILADLSEDNELVQSMIDELDEDARGNAGQKGMPQTFIDDLERVDKKRLKKEEACPICTERFLDGEFDILHGGMIWSGA